MLGWGLADHHNQNTSALPNGCLTVSYSSLTTASRNSVRAEMGSERAQKGCLQAVQPIRHLVFSVVLSVEGRSEQGRPEGLLTSCSVTNSQSLAAWEWKVSDLRVSGQVWLSYMLISSLRSCPGPEELLFLLWGSVI